MNKSIFRDIFQYNNQRWKGTALVTTFLPAIVVNCIALLFVFVFICLIIFTNYNRRSQVQGEVITHYLPINVYAPQQGYITELMVKLGDSVQKGTPLYRIDVSRVTQQGKLSQNMVSVIEGQLEQVEHLIELMEQNKRNAIENTHNQLNKHQEMYQKTQKLLEHSSAELNRLRRNVVEYKTFLKQGLVKKDDINYQQYLYQQQQNTHQNFYSQLIQEELQITNLTSELTSLQLKFNDQILQYEYRRYDLQKQLLEITANDTIVINSPSEGKVESLTVTIGQMVNSGDSLAQILPQQDNHYYAVLWLPNTSIAYIQEGDDINIRYDAFPFEKFGQFPGKIISISSVPASKQELSQYGSAPYRQNGQPDINYYKAIISLSTPQLTDSGKSLALTSGMTLQSTLFLEERPMYQWMFAPFYRINKSISGPIHEKE